MRQSSGPQQADKHAAAGAAGTTTGTTTGTTGGAATGADHMAPAAARTPRGAPLRRVPLDLANASLVVGLVGGIMLSICAWMLRRELARAGTWTLLALVGAVAGGALVLAALFVASLAAPATGEGARSIVDSLDAAARGDFVNATPQPMPGLLAPIAQGTRQAFSHVRSLLLSLRELVREVAARAADLASQVSALPGAAQRTSEQLSLAGHRLAALGDASRAAQGEAVRTRDTAQALVREHRTTLERGTRAADGIRDSVDDLGDSAARVQGVAAAMQGSLGDLEALARSAEEIREFAALVRKMARQSKLLALNAAMEAARAGEQGSGFAVVAGEVRRLARSSTEAAERTDALVNDVLARADRSRLGALEGSNVLESTHQRLSRVALTLREHERAWHAAPASADDDALLAAPLADALASRLDQVLEETTALGTLVREAQLSAGAQLARTQDVAALAGTLVRVAQKAAAAAATPRLDAPSLAAADGSAPDAAAAPPPREPAAPRPELLPGT
ncbi:MAG: hypothetical protein IT359_02465 [Gemmatimonadaceae bacterium]|nr:hypothetical protein [Gemmatimonadaceae bacterium]